MKFPAAPIESLQNCFGYTERESRFLYVICTHSGHFLGRQFTQFANTVRGRPLRDFVAKTAANRHSREYLHSEAGAKRYHLYSKPLYSAIGKTNSAHRRKHEIAKIVVKLQTIDFILQHLEFDYLDEESDKVHYFHETLGIDKVTLPCRVYKARNERNASTTRYFVDKFPIFFDAQNTLSFTFIDDPLLSTDAFKSHLLHYLPLFCALRVTFRVWFTSSIPSKFAQAENVFRATLSRINNSGDDRELLHYFELRRRWEARDLGGFTPELVRERVELAKKYQGPYHDSLYRDWVESPEGSREEAKKEKKLDAELVTYQIRT